MWIQVFCWTLSIAISSGLEFADYTCKPVIDKAQATVYMPLDSLTDGEFSDGTYTTNTLHGTPLLVTGKLGQALSLDGSTAISVGEARDACFWDPGLCTDGFTLAFWMFNVVRNNDGKEPYLVSNGGQTSTSYGITILPETGSMEGDRGLIIVISSKEKKVSITDTTWRNGTKDGVWHHIAVTFKDEEMAYYEDGVFVTTAKMVDRSSAIMESIYNHYTLGAPNNKLDTESDNYWGVGYLDEFLFWDTHNEAAFVADLYNSYEDTSGLTECDEHHTCRSGVCECTNGESGSNCTSDRHVLLRAATQTPSAETLYSLWTGDTFTPALSESVDQDYVSLSVDVKNIYKSAIVECSWDHVENVRYSYYTAGEEVAYFSSSAMDTDKVTWFSGSGLYGSSFADMLKQGAFDYFSVEGHTTETHKRRFYTSITSNSCDDESGYFVTLDTDHQNDCAWETVGNLNDLPVFLHCPDTSACSSDTWIRADVTEITADLGSAFGGSCVSTCKSMDDGQYQSCLGCNVYVVCASQSLTYTSCRHGTHFDTAEEACVESSSTCQDNDALAQCLPDECTPNNPCSNSGACSMADAGWQCDCSTETSGYGGPICEVIVSYCTAHSGEDVCNNGTCSDEADGGHSCSCDSGYTGDTCETATYCKANEGDTAVCSNGGLCVDEEDGTNHHCDCAAGYFGENCDEESFCTSNPNHCLNEGTCVDNQAAFVRCNCAGSYMGTTCVDLDVCAVSNPCEHDGVCSYTQDGSSQCTCADGWLGNTCGVEDPCESDPCQNEGTCAEVMVDDGIYSYQCTCTQHFSGDDCEVGPCQADEYADQCGQSTGSCVNKQDGSCKVETDIVDFADNKSSSHSRVGWMTWISFVLSIMMVIHLSK